ncbi:MAG: SRPBCC domain-containing protein [Myxococcota bacterium]
MKLETIVLAVDLPVPPAKLFDAWLDSKAHSAFSGSKATIEPEVGGSFSAWDGYIQGKTLEIEPTKRIVQTWRTSEFQKDDRDSSIELIFKETIDGTRMVLRHTEIPPGQGDKYSDGWKDFYFAPMSKYFAKPVKKKAAPKKKKAPVKTAAPKKKAPVKKAAPKKAAPKKAAPKKAAPKKKARAAAKKKR